MSDLQMEQSVMRFRAFSVSLVSTALAILALATSWAHVVIANDGVVVDWWTYNFRGIVDRGALFPYSGVGFQIVTVVLILLVCCTVLSATLTLSIRSKGWPLKEKLFLRLSFISMALSGVNLVLLSVFAPRRIMEYSFIWHNSSRVLSSGVTRAITGSPGLAWYMIVFFIFLQAILVYTLRRIDVDYLPLLKFSKKNG